MSKLDNLIINKRIEYLRKRKKQILSQPKATRAISLQYLDSTISRLKRWKKEINNKNLKKQ